MTKTCLVTVLTTLFCVWTQFKALHADGNSGLTDSDVKALAFAALPSQTAKLPGLTLEVGKRKASSKCTVVDVLWNNPGQGSPHVLFYSVDLRTGDVWMPMSCERASNSRLQKLQLAVRKRLHVTEDEYNESINRAPCCGFE